jgi:hypothetical protein
MIANTRPVLKKKNFDTQMHISKEEEEEEEVN